GPARGPGGDGRIVQGHGPRRAQLAERGRILSCKSGAAYQAPAMAALETVRSQTMPAGSKRRSHDPLSWPAMLISMRCEPKPSVGLRCGGGPPRSTQRSSSVSPRSEIDSSTLPSSADSAPYLAELV